MHILEIPSFFTPYGGEFCLDQAKALKALDHEVRILSNVQLGTTIGLRDYLWLPYTRYEHQRDGITVYQSYQRGLPRSVRFNVNSWLRIVCSMFEDYIKRYGKPDILHAHCAKWAGYAAMLINKKHHVPYVITEHLPKMLFEQEFGKAPSGAWQIPLLKSAYENANMVLPVSEDLVDELACYFGKSYRWQYLSNTIDTDFFHYHKRDKSEGRAFRFCCLADYSYRKGYDVLFKSFRTLLDNGCNVELHIAGRNTERVKQSYVKAHGRLDKQGVRELLYHCDALVLASRSEVQPLVVLEAMSTGIPVVGTTSIPRCLRIEGGCRIVAVDDAAALAEAMQTLLKEPVVDDVYLSEQVREIASPEVIGKQLQTIFYDVLASI